MSDTEEPFDKEAEKEKLREQLRREEEARRSTQHMSELLLKGATMTNKHCDTCGDPLFRHEGQEFCPTCAQDAAGATAAEAGAEPSADAEPEPSGIDRVDTETEPTSSGIEAAGGSERSAELAGGTGDVGPDRPAERAREAGDVGAAREAVVRKLTALAQQAEATEDVGRSRELLAAAREAAEVLAAIEGVRR